MRARAVYEVTRHGIRVYEGELWECVGKSKCARGAISVSMGDSLSARVESLTSAREAVHMRVFVLRDFARVKSTLDLFYVRSDMCGCQQRLT